jgi:glycosyltransferase involved in cell wall biosynthesis
MIASCKSVSGRPLISVCITTFNQKQYISTTIMSVVSQCGQGQDFDLEILIGDDSSTDGSSEVISRLAEQFPLRICHFRHVQNLGANENFKFLVNKSAGDYLAHLDGDDYWLPDKLSRQLARLNSSKELIACYSNAMVIDSENRLAGFFTNSQPEHIEFEYLAAHGNFLNFSSILYKSEAKSEIQKLTFPMIDYEIHLTLARMGKLSFINEPLACYRWMSSTSMLRNQFADFSVAYMAALCRLLPRASHRVKVEATALFILTTLMKRPDWILNTEFWQRIDALRSALTVSVIELFWPGCCLAIAGLRMRFRTVLIKSLGGLPAVFPRI